MKQHSFNQQFHAHTGAPFRWNVRRSGLALRDYITLSFVVFIVAIVACIWIAPEGARDNNGISYYDHVSWALIPYVTGVLAISAFCLLSARGLPSRAPVARWLRPALEAIAVLLVLVLMTPDYVDEFFNWAHVTIAVILFGLQFVLIAWFALAIQRDALNVALFLALLAVGLLAGASQLDVTSYLFPSQVAFQLIFLAVLSRTIAAVDADRAEARRREAAKRAADAA